MLPTHLKVVNKDKTFLTTEELDNLEWWVAFGKIAVAAVEEAVEVGL